MWNWNMLYLDIINIKFALCQSYRIENIQPWTQYVHYKIEHRPRKFKGHIFLEGTCQSELGLHNVEVEYVFKLVLKFLSKNPISS